MPDEDQVVRYSTVEGRSVAWASVGTGPPLLVGGWWSGHLGLDWKDHRFRRFVSALATQHRIIRYDRPGCGLSDRSGPSPASREDEVAVLAGLVEAIGLESLSLFGASSGAVVAAGFAAAEPSRVDRLVVYGGYAHGADIASPAARELTIDVVRRHWGLGSRVLADLFMPGATAAERAGFAAFQRQAATPEAAAAELALAYRLDARDALRTLTLPTLVLHRRADRAIPFALGQDVASLVRGARLVELQGDEHFPWRGDSRAVTDATAGFLAGRDPRPAAAPAGGPAASTLSPREAEVLRLVAAGHTDAQIARELTLSAHTVHRHVSNIRTKLGVPSRAAAAAWAARQNL
ncbi:alpha/beta fold hydrolase [Nocardioides dongkuii]|uniref:alpha/beta fold hydrolase n=1 Tax=Nocardioides dongkuii TaxID=2760089 RepID=UPI0015F8E2D7|nr:alpha/beta fold hydrolase [Nocardioides dongkuii]